MANSLYRATVLTKNQLGNYYVLIWGDNTLLLALIDVEGSCMLCTDRYIIISRALFANS